MSIKPEDLRIGNYLQLHVAGIYKVAEIKSHNVEFEGLKNGSFYDYSILHGIPLTEEILVGWCGFAWETKNKTHIQIDVKNDGYDFRICLYFKDGIIEHLQLYENSYLGGITELPPPKNLHQLQNLYYSLTQTELPVKL